MYILACVSIVSRLRPDCVSILSRRSGAQRLPTCEAEAEDWALDEEDCGGKPTACIASSVSPSAPDPKEADWDWAALDDASPSHGEQRARVPALVTWEESDDAPPSAPSAPAVLQPRGTAPIMWEEDSVCARLGDKLKPLGAQRLDYHGLD